MEAKVVEEDKDSVGFGVSCQSEIEDADNAKECQDKVSHYVSLQGMSRVIDIFQYPRAGSMIQGRVS